MIREPEGLLCKDGHMPTEIAPSVLDTPELRKSRGAFFTPASITRFISEWAIRDSSDRVLEPSAGDAAFLVASVERLRTLDETTAPTVDGIEIHEDSAATAQQRVTAAGAELNMTVGDFFTVDPQPTYDAVIGNPPYIRYQDFAGASRTLSRAAALRAGVNLTALASSWAAFTVHSALFLKEGGRLGLVLPSELLSVNYASVVRQFLLKSFSDVQLVLFRDQVFEDAEADVVLLLADGYGQGPTDHASIRQADNADALELLTDPVIWTPNSSSEKWTGLLADPAAMLLLKSMTQDGILSNLEDWGDTTLGMVTGNNRYFTLSPQRVKELGIPRSDLRRLSPPGSRHLRALELTDGDLQALGRKGEATWLFRPEGTIGQKSKAYIEMGEQTGVSHAYKCRVRPTWHRVPLVPPADLLLTYMNAVSPQLATNTAGALHLNSVHGVYLKDDFAELGRELLPLAALNSVTRTHAEFVGRSYGGGILKVEPREAAAWLMPSAQHITDRAEQLRKIKSTARQHLKDGELEEATKLVDEALFDKEILSEAELEMIRTAGKAMHTRRETRGRSGR